MKKHYSIRYKACGLVFAIAATNVLAVTGSPLNLGSSKLFPESTLTIARADDVLSEDIILSADDLRIGSDGKVIEGLSDTGKAKLMSAIKENAVYQLVFPESLSATEIKGEAFYYIYESLATSSNPDDFEKYKTAQKMKITVKLSDNITKVGDGAFRQNPYITGVIFGDKTEYIGKASFQFCKIKGELILPDTISYIGSGAFNDNRITEVKLPDNIKKVEHRAFSDNRITRFDFGAYTSVNTEANIGRIVTPDDDAEEFIKVSGKVIPDYFLTNNPLSEIVLPSGITAIGIEAFRLAQDSDFRPDYPVNNLIIPETVEDIGVAAFMGHPINSLTLTGSSLKRIRESAFEDSHIGGDLTIPDSVNIIENKAFKNNNLKSIMVGGLKAEIKSANSTDNSPFSDNPGWYDDNRKVALYRGNEANEFITDNKLAGTTTYVYNPVVLEFNIKDKNGVDLKPATISVARENATVPDVTDVKDTEYDTYKLGDKLTFTLSGSLPDGYEFSASGINSLGNNAYELTLDPANTELIKTITYEDMYKAGYKKAVISIREKAVVPEPQPEPSTPVYPVITPIITPVVPSTPAQPAVIDDNTTVDTNEDSTPEGNTDVEEDTTPRGKTEKAKNNEPKTTDVVDENTPQGKLPKTGGTGEGLLVMLGGALLGLGALIKRKIK